jgi:N-acetylglucosaminyl-diphospho-decaprenol L-rhamnosyltransferase
VTERLVASAEPSSPHVTDSRPDLSVLVVSFNTRELTLVCIDSIFREGRDLELQVLVVDNASKDGSAEAIAERFPHVELFALDENLGFGRANNLAGEHVRADWMLLLNPDTEMLEGSLAAMFAFARERGRCMVGGRTFHADGTLQPSSCWGEPSLWGLVCTATGLSSVFRRNPIFDPDSLGGWQRDTVREVDILSGCLIMLPTSLWRELGGFDEDFFMYSEDFDLSLRARSLGAPRLICPDARVVHLGGASERIRADKMVRLIVAKVQLFEKHWPRWKTKLAIRLLDGWAFTRMATFSLLRLVRGGARQSYEDWRTIWLRRREWHAPKPPPPRKKTPDVAESTR